MADCVAKNVMAFHEKLNEFWNCGKYCDTVIEVEGKLFICHRLALTMASEYFDVMFNGYFSESKSRRIILDHIDAIAFQEVLRFFYTGDAVITKENVYGVLRASDFFQLAAIEELCNQFIQRNLSSLPSSLIFEIFSFVSLTRNDSLTKIVSEYIMKNFDTFPQNDEFFKLSFEDLNILISLHWHLSARNSERFLSALIAWVDYGGTMRDNYREELMEKIELQYISANCSSNNLFIEKYPNFRISQKCIPDLHIYSMNSMYYERLRVSSMKRSDLQWSSKECWMGGTILSLGCIGFGNYLYCLNEQDGRRYNGVDFSAFPSVNVSPNSSKRRVVLESPPGLLATDYVSMCSIQSNIYLSNAVESRSEIKRAVDVPTSEFSPKQISQGIYRYNTDIDKWFPVPLVEKEVDIIDIMGKPTTVINDILYLIKNVNARAHLETPNNFSSLSILALDHRVSEWQKLTTFVAKNTRFGKDIACCAHEGNIYVASSLYEKGWATYDVEILRYNLVANKWEKIVPIFKQPSQVYPIRKLLSHGSYIWAFGDAKRLPVINVYNSYIQKWGPPPIPEMIHSVDDFYYSSSSEEEYKIRYFSDTEYFELPRPRHFLDAVSFSFE